ncbi:MULTISPECIES: cytochrome o ubiquinol oxidase subunit IV [Brevibacillus]|uniref:Cytochrome o ubiquinol oxidase subunit IV n=1 Tax=Brevibacillus invocatus TaxID=173959 RepID=A0A3M8BYU1_9BACL|nr:MULTISPECIES: cytochrome o ubiquinol oxidase subunit IV [Brevibacillus]MCM3081530.1 cytochrome o ubiquinol oxidase subunit IV [Brevibacillus invocatus]MCM3431901.1 cytochrome o ubiquinol oxidase subunit IV [Brevibacillus invocatus]MDH4618688.1 cytochrome o ubiquinol oxidase subunit IV [Brevibacillus sp. AY1]RNB68523.1 cytochrome o ubiquinol oxidase subunit IV [Brevibacillus invocatus]
MANHGNHSSHAESHGSLKSYVIGFILSIVLTVIPLVLVMNPLFSKTATYITIMIMAILQFVVQLFFFMHIREGEKPRWNVQTLILGLFIVLTIIGGSIWIMAFNV